MSQDKNQVVEFGFVSHVITAEDWASLMPQNVVRLRIKFGFGDQDFEWVNAGICRKFEDMMVLEFDYAPADPQESGKRLPERHASIRVFKDQLTIQQRVRTAMPGTPYPYSSKTEEERLAEQKKINGGKRKPKPNKRPSTVHLGNDNAPQMAA